MENKSKIFKTNFHEITPMASAQHDNTGQRESKAKQQQKDSCTASARVMKPGGSLWHLLIRSVISTFNTQNFIKPHP